MGEDEWFEVYGVLLEHFDPADEDWKELIFKLWMTRVLNYTVTEALRGFNGAQRYLRNSIKRYGRRAALGRAPAP